MTEHLPFVTLLLVLGVAWRVGRMISRMNRNEGSDHGNSESNAPNG